MSSNRSVASRRTSSQNLARHDLELASHARVLEKAQARVALERKPRVDGIPRGLAPEDVPLQAPEERVARGLDEPVVVIELRDGIERANVLSPGPAPELEQRGVVGIEVFPEAFARADRINDDLARERKAREELVKARREPREPEHVHGAHSAGRPPRGDGFVERNEPPCATQPALAEHRQPQGPLPRLRLGVPRVERPSLLPADEHVGARIRVFLEETADPSGELRSPRRHAVGRGSGSEVGTERLELGLVEEPVLAQKECERHALERLRPCESAADLRARRLRREARQKHRIEVCRDTVRARESEADEGLDASARHDEAHGHEGSLTSLLGTHSIGELDR